MTDTPPPPPQGDPLGSERQPNGPGAPGEPYGGGYQAPPLRPEDEKLWSTLIHIGGIFFSFVPAIIGYFVLRDRGPFIKEHTRVALNFQLTMLIGYVVGTILSVVGIGLLIDLAVWVVTIVFSIMAAIAANQGRYSKYPLSIEFFKS
ncbi:hypothetical protein AS850_08485 [Frondihabitans sp. 762G35]|uniref:DUF4870 domain-containing protein n=1 Tax=Frondihabitans sp. 762G35 TaxID=1446794 RepID=UPI000D20172F|nr:DUF4870 domain-containing protein [Frondihabitans sp. 762G35]ARC57109.1 hypothetical protein AS850_08485 [Frondihabitans sp. 762G35]